MVRTVLPTDAELQILSVLWKRGPSTVRDVHESLANVQDTGYTTVLKLMQIMAQKGFVERDETNRSHVYRAAITEDQAQRGLLGQLMDKAFSGSASQLVMRALSMQSATTRELDEIRALLDDLEARRTKK
ncbi:MAG TPA: BlaI/MecI/CopY family transcriptional regulator [Polyangium sp.]|nr:BlaI/MecI/CopY family transcriptional regulator [Polyangium sp.]